MIIPTRCKIYSALLAAAVVSVGVWGYGKLQYSAGYAASDAAAKLRETQISNDALDRYGQLVVAARQREHALQDAFDAEHAQREKENADHEKIIADYRARARAGDERLRVNVARCSDRGTATGEGTGPGTGTAQWERTDLMPGTADALFGIAGRVAGLVRRYDAVVTDYDRIRAACNEPLSEPR